MSELEPGQQLVGRGSTAVTMERVADGVWLMRRVGLAWDVVQITPQRQAQKLVGYQKPAPPVREPEKVPELA